MASNGKRGGGDRVLESRHLVGLFLGVVLLCGVFFTLGYVMGRTQYGGAVHAADVTTRFQPPAAAKAPTKDPATAGSKPSSSGWDDSFDPNKVPEKRLEPPPAAHSASPLAVSTSKKANGPAATAKPPASTKEAARFQPPALNKNSIVLQVAAVKQQRDALEMADEIQRKRFPAFVANSPADAFYHVQVGPYPDTASAEKAKAALEQLGFKPIIKH
jgi:cell division septation protein DedD